MFVIEILLFGVTLCDICASSMVLNQLIRRDTGSLFLNSYLSNLKNTHFEI